MSTFKYYCGEKEQEKRVKLSLRNGNDGTVELLAEEPDTKVYFTIAIIGLNRGATGNSITMIEGVPDTIGLKTNKNQIVLVESG